MMKKILNLFLFSIFLISIINTASAAQLSITDPHGLGIYEQPAGYTGYSTENLFIYADGTTLYWCDYGLVSASATVYNLPYAVSDVCADYNYIYLVTYNGYGYRIPNELGLTDWESIPEEVIEGLGSCGSIATSGDYPYRIMTDDAGDIYVSNGDDGQILKFDANTLTSVIYVSGVDPFNHQPISISGGSNLYLTTIGSSSQYDSDVTTQDILTANDVNTKVYQFSLTDEATYGAGSPSGVAELTNGNIVVAAQNSYNNNVYIYEYYPNGTLLGDIATISGSNYDYQQTGDLIVTPNGVVVHLDEIANVIRTYATVSETGGYFTSTTPIESGAAEEGEEVNINSSIVWDKSIYNTGETATISFNVENYDYVAYDYQIKIADTASLKQTYTIEDVVNSSVEYTFSLSATTSTYLAQLIAIDGNSGASEVLAMNTTSFDNEESYSVGFDSSTYHIGDTMSIYYSVPANSSIYLRGTDSNSQTVYSNSWSVSGNSHLSLTVPENTVESYTAYALYNGYTLDYDVTEVIQSVSDVAVYGSVYDASTGAPISAAHILINGSGPISNSVGRYSTVIEAGIYDLVISKDGYNTQRFYDVPFMVDTNRNFYLTSSSGSSSGDESSLYGVVRDYETGAALEGAMVTVTNSSFTKTTFTSSTGFYDITGLANNTSYSVYSNLDDYDNYYNGSVTVTGMTWHEFDLIDESYSLGGSGSSTTTEERTSRTSAQETLNLLEETIPNLIIFVVFVVFMAVMKKG